MSNIKDIWLKQESTTSKQVVRERVSSIKGLKCYVGIVGFTGAKVFQIELNNKTKVQSAYLKRFSGVEIQVIPDDHGITNAFTIILLDPSLSDLFILFIEDIVNNLQKVYAVEDGLPLIYQRIDHWRKLFTRMSSEKLSVEQQRGLFGELHVLEKLLENQLDKSLAINAWYGSSGTHQDFAIENIAIEVKTSKTVTAKIQISNEFQLDYTRWKHLYLCLIMVNESAGNGNTLFKQIVTIRNLLTDYSELTSKFDRKLALVGITRDLEEDYDDVNYVVTSLKYYYVQEGFPLITEETIKDKRISKVKYQIDVRECTPFELSQTDVFAKFSNVSN